MPQGDPGGNFQGGYGGNFGGAGGSSMNSQVGGPAHGSLGYGGMSPGGFNSSNFSQGEMSASGTQNRANRAAMLARMAARYPNWHGFGGIGGAANRNRVTPEWLAAQRVRRNRPEVSIEDPITGAEEEVAPGPIFPEPVVDEETVNYPGPGGDISNWGGYGAYGQAPFGWGKKDQSRVPQGSGGNPYGSWGSPGNLNSVIGGGQGPGRQFGGPVAPGGQYTVGENGPETLQMAPGGGGQVIPNNQADAAAGGIAMGSGELKDYGNPLLRGGAMSKPTPVMGNTPGFGGGPGPQPVQQGGPMPQPMQQPQPTSLNTQPLGGLNPQMMQQWMQLLQQYQPGQQPGGMPQTGGSPPPPVMGGGMPPQPGGGGINSQLRTMQPGGWRDRMGIAGLSRPPQSGGGFGLSGLGRPGIVPQMTRQYGGQLPTGQANLIHSGQPVGSGGATARRI